MWHLQYGGFGKMLYAKANPTFIPLSWILAARIERWKHPEFNNRHPCWSATSAPCSWELQSISNADAFWINRVLELDTLPVVRFRCMYLHHNAQTSLCPQCKCFLLLSMEIGVRGHRTRWLCCCWMERQSYLTEGIIIGQMAGWGHFIQILWRWSECSWRHIRRGSTIWKLAAFFMQTPSSRLDHIWFNKAKQVCFVPGFSRYYSLLFCSVPFNTVSVDGNGNIFIVTMRVLTFSKKTDASEEN